MRQKVGKMGFECRILDAKWVELVLIEVLQEVQKSEPLWAWAVERRIAKVGYIWEVKRFGPRG
jgi:hypothetical protein